MTVTSAIFYSSSKRELDHEIAKSLKRGFKTHGIKVVIKEKMDVIGDEDIAITVGIKQQSKKIMDAYFAAGKHVLYVDKPYIRKRREDIDLRVMTHYRFALDCFQPLDYFQDKPRPSGRWDALEIELEPQKTGGKYIIFAGSSEKYSVWNHIPHPTLFAKTVIEDIQTCVPGVPIMYRYKPSWKNAVKIPGTIHSKSKIKIEMELRKARGLVTHGSNAALDAIFAGVPAVVFGDGIAKPMSTSLIDLGKEPYFPNDNDRFQWACDLAYCQWDFDEMASGAMWDDIKNQLPLGERRVWLWRKQQEKIKEASK